MTWFRKMIMSIVELLFFIFSLSLCLPLSFFFFAFLRSPFVRSLTWWMASSGDSMKVAANLGKSSYHTCWYFNGHFLWKNAPLIAYKHVHSEIIYAFHIVSRRTRQCLLHFIDVYFRCFPLLCVCVWCYRHFIEKNSSECEWKFIFRCMPITSTYPSLVWLWTV